MARKRQTKPSPKYQPRATKSQFAFYGPALSGQNTNGHGVGGLDADGALQTNSTHISDGGDIQKQTENWHEDAMHMNNATTDPMKTTIGYGNVAAPVIKQDKPKRSIILKLMESHQQRFLDALCPIHHDSPAPGLKALLDSWPAMPPYYRLKTFLILANCDTGQITAGPHDNCRVRRHWLSRARQEAFRCRETYDANISDVQIVMTVGHWVDEEWTVLLEEEKAAGIGV